eukprot:UN03178
MQAHHRRIRGDHYYAAAYSQIPQSHWDSIDFSKSVWIGISLVLVILVELFHYAALIYFTVLVGKNANDICDVVVKKWSIAICVIEWVGHTGLSALILISLFNG